VQDFGDIGPSPVPKKTIVIGLAHCIPVSSTSN
jgi:hypothetical protein